MRFVIHNHVPTRRRSIGTFRATGGAHDHTDCGCGCGGKGNCGHSHDKAYTKADLGIDVRYAKGPMGKTLTETRHYTIPGVTVDPRGYSPEPAFVATQLRKLPAHGDMVRDGWRAEHAEGYYKREQRDVGRQI